MKRLSIFLAFLLLAVVTVLPALAWDPPGVCHWNGHSYDFITATSDAEWEGHKKHPKDIVGVESAKDCPKVEEPKKTPTSSRPPRDDDDDDQPDDTPVPTATNVPAATKTPTPIRIEKTATPTHTAVPPTRVPTQRSTPIPTNTATRTPTVGVPHEQSTPVPVVDIPSNPPASVVPSNPSVIPQAPVPIAFPNTGNGGLKSLGFAPSNEWQPGYIWWWFYEDAYGYHDVYVHPDFGYPALRVGWLESKWQYGALSAGYDSYYGYYYYCGDFQVDAYIHGWRYRAHGWDPFTDCYDSGKNAVIAHEIWWDSGWLPWPNTARGYY